MTAFSSPPRARGLPGHQDVFQYHLFAAACLYFFDEQFRRIAAQHEHILVHGGELRLHKAAQGGVIVAHDGHVLGHPDAQALAGVQCAHSHEVVAAEHRGGVPLGQHGQQPVHGGIHRMQAVALADVHDIACVQQAGFRHHFPIDHFL